MPTIPASPLRRGRSGSWSGGGGLRTIDGSPLRHSLSRGARSRSSSARHHGHGRSSPSPRGRSRSRSRSRLPPPSPISPRRRSSSYRRLRDDESDDADDDDPDCDDLYCHDDRELARSVGIPLHVSTPIRPPAHMAHQMAMQQEPSPMRSLASADDPFADIHALNGSSAVGGGAGGGNPFAPAAAASPSFPNATADAFASTAASSGGAGAFGGSSGGAFGGGGGRNGFQHAGPATRRPGVNETIDAITASWDAKADEDDAEVAARRRIEEMLNSSKDGASGGKLSPIQSHRTHARSSSTGRPNTRGRSPARRSPPNTTTIGNTGINTGAAAPTMSALLGTPTHMEVLNGASAANTSFSHSTTSFSHGNSLLADDSHGNSLLADDSHGNILLADDSPMKSGGAANTGGTGGGPMFARGRTRSLSPWQGRRPSLGGGAAGSNAGSAAGGGGKKLLGKLLRGKGSNGNAGGGPSADNDASTTRGAGTSAAAPATPAEKRSAKKIKKQAAKAVKAAAAEEKKQQKLLEKEQKQLQKDLKKQAALIASTPATPKKTLGRRGRSPTPRGRQKSTNASPSASQRGRSRSQSRPRSLSRGLSLPRVLSFSKARSRSRSMKRSSSKGSAAGNGGLKGSPISLFRRSLSGSRGNVSFAKDKSGKNSPNVKISVGSNEDSAAYGGGGRGCGAVGGIFSQLFGSFDPCALMPQCGTSLNNVDGSAAVPDYLNSTPARTTGGTKGGSPQSVAGVPDWLDGQKKAVDMPQSPGKQTNGRGRSRSRSQGRGRSRSRSKSAGRGVLRSLSIGRKKEKSRIM